MTKLNKKLRHQAHRQSGITHHPDPNAVYSKAYLQAQPQAYPQALPSNLYVGSGSCHHSISYYFGGDCGLCFLKFAFEGELPGQLHLSKTLADNGNPQQTGKLEAHVYVIEGFEPPKPGQNLHSYRRSRASRSEPAHKIYPVTSALWELMGYQPPLATPLIYSVSGYSDPKIAEILDISVFNLNERRVKAVRWTLGALRI